MSLQEYRRTLNLVHEGTDDKRIAFVCSTPRDLWRKIYDKCLREDIGLGLYIEFALEHALTIDAKIINDHLNVIREREKV